MPGKAKREKDRKWKLASNAAWDFLPASLLREAPAVWVPGIDLVPSGEDVPWVSSTWGKTVWGAGQETWTPVGATGVSGRRFGPVHVFRYRPNRVGVATRAWYILAQAASLGGTPSAAYAAAGAEPLTRRQQLGVGRTREAIGNLPAVKELALHLGAEFVRLGGSAQPGGGPRYKRQQRHSPCPAAVGGCSGPAACCEWRTPQQPGRRDDGGRRRGHPGWRR